MLSSFKVGVFVLSLYCVGMAGNGCIEFPPLVTRTPTPTPTPTPTTPTPSPTPTTETPDTVIDAASKSIEYTGHVPFTETVVDEILLRNRDSEEFRVQVSTTITLEQRGSYINGTLETSIPASIWGGRVRVTISFTSSNKQTLYTRESTIFSSERSETDVTRYFSVRLDDIRNAAQINLTHESIDYNPCRDDSCPNVAIDPSHEPATHVFILPGILGDSANIRSIKAILEESMDEEGRPIKVRTWDWAAVWPEEQQSLQDRLYITQETCRLGDRFAQAVARWRSESTNVGNVHLIAMSAGTMVAKAACGVTMSDDGYVLYDDFFDKIVFLSGALDVRESWENLDRCSHQIFNYYSYADQVLATRFPTFLIFRIRIAVAWPACGGVGLKKRPETGSSGFDAESDHVAWQLPWIRREDGGRGESLGNDGGHLSPGCLSEDYFSEYILPLFTGAPMPLYPDVEDGWSPDIHGSYRQDQTEAGISISGWGLESRESPATCP